MEKTNKNNRHKIAVGCMLALLLILAAAAGIGYWRKFPSIRVMRGIANLAEEIKEYENPVSEEAGWEEILKQLQYGAVHVNADMELETPDIGITILGAGALSSTESSIRLAGRIELDGSIDQRNRLMSGSLKLHMLERELLEADVAADAENLYLTFPALFKDALRMEAADFGAKFNASSWHKITGWTLPEDYQLKIFREDLQETMAVAMAGAMAEAMAEGENAIDFEHYEQLFSKTAALAQNIKVSSAGKSLEIEKEGQKENCKGYLVKVEPETANKILAAVSEQLKSKTGGKLEEEAAFLNGSVTETVKLEIYLDGEDRIVHLNTAEPLHFSNPAVTMELAADLTGTERTADEAECRISILQAAMEESSEGALVITWNAEPTADSCKKQLTAEWTAALSEGSNFLLESEWDYASGGFDITAAYSGDDASYNIILQGTLESVTPEESVRITLDSGAIQKNDKEPVALAGTFLVDPLSEEILIPQESRDLFSLSVLDMLKLLMQFQIEKAAGL